MRSGRRLIQVMVDQLSDTPPGATAAPGRSDQPGGWVATQKALGSIVIATTNL
jgi:hypothetical protein